MAAIKGDVIDIAQPRTPDLIADRILYEHDEYERHQRKAIEHAIRCGELLAEAKQQVGHGNWTPWVNAHLDFTARTASNYMRIAANEKRVSDLGSVREALADLADPKPKRPPGPSTLDPFGPRWVPHLGRSLPLPRTTLRRSLGDNDAPCP
jgi:hypothetical protein